MTSKRTSRIAPIKDLEEPPVPIGMKHTATKSNDHLHQALKSLKPSSFVKDTKDERLTIRLSGKDRESMEQLAKSLGLTVADYLIQLHHVAAEKLGLETQP